MHRNLLLSEYKFHENCFIFIFCWGLWLFRSWCLIDSLIFDSCLNFADKCICYDVWLLICLVFLPEWSSGCGHILACLIAFHSLILSDNDVIYGLEKEYFFRILAHLLTLLGLDLNLPQVLLLKHLKGHVVFSPHIAHQKGLLFFLDTKNEKWLTFKVLVSQNLGLTSHFACHFGRGTRNNWTWESTEGVKIDSRGEKLVSWLEIQEILLV